MLSWFLRLTAVTVVALSLFLQFKTFGGWLSIIGIFLWPVVGLAHVVFHSIRLPRTGSIPGSRIVLITGSHLLLIAGFLLQYDVGDGPDWLTITALLYDMSLLPSRYAPAWWPRGPATNIGVFIPVFVTWALLLKASRPPG